MFLLQYFLYCKYFAISTVLLSGTDRSLMDHCDPRITAEDLDRMKSVLYRLTVCEMKFPTWEKKQENKFSSRCTHR